MSERESFRAEAVRTLRREVPDDLEWLFRHPLPALRWRGDGGRVEEVIPRGWLVAAALRGDPEPDAELRRRAALSRGPAPGAAGAVPGAPQDAAQCRAFLRMLASIDGAAVADLLSSARRYPELCEEAEKLLVARASRGA